MIELKYWVLQLKILRTFENKGDQIHLINWAFMLLNDGRLFTRLDLNLSFHMTFKIDWTNNTWKTSRGFSPTPLIKDSKQ